VIAAGLLLFAGGAAWVIWTTLHRPALVETAVAIATASDAPSAVLDASGYVTARREATVSSKVTGQIQDVLFEEGQKAEQGQVLARLDPSNIKTTLQLAQSQWDVAKSALGETEAQLIQAEKDLQRTIELTKGNVLSESDLDKARASADSLRARLARQKVEVVVAERQVATWQQQLDDTVIRAPFAGVIVSKTAQPGEIISPLSAGGGFTRTGVCTIVDMASLEIEVDVNENYINRVAPGQRVRALLDAYPDWPIPCKVIAIIPTADRQKGTVKVRISFDQLDARILPDMGVKVAFQSPEEPTRAAASVLVPEPAIHLDGERNIVWVVHRQKVERRAVKTGDRQNDNVVVLAGLRSGEEVVLNPPAALKDGDVIREKKP
jgi:RND family efflux transporter MFP subunit